MILLTTLSFLFASVQTEAKTGQAVIKDLAAKLKPIQSLTLSMKVSMMGNENSMKVKVLRGGYFRGVSQNGSELILTPSRGWLLTPERKEYETKTAAQWREEAKSDGSSIENLMPGFESLFPGGKLLNAISGPESGTLAGKSTFRIRVEQIPILKAPSNFRLYLHMNAETILPAGIEMITPGGTFHKISGYGSSPQTMVYTDIRLDAHLTPKDFLWTPPKDWKQAKLDAPEAALLPRVRFSLSQ